MKLDSAVKIQQDRQQRNQRERKGRAKPPAVVEEINRKPPTPEQLEKNGFQSAGMAYRKTAVIDTMLKRKQITSVEYVALSYYRQQATAADRSAIKSNIDFTVRTGQQMPIGYATPQKIETDRIEADLGKLAAIVRAIAVDDVSISEWCIAKYGGRERLKGRRIVIAATEGQVERALIELKRAARGINV